MKTWGGQGSSYRFVPEVSGTRKAECSSPKGWGGAAEELGCRKDTQVWGYRGSDVFQHDLLASLDKALVTFPAIIRMIPATIEKK